ALVDFALRRRFHAFELQPDRIVLQGYLDDREEDGELALRFFDVVQEHVIDRDFAPGHAYWMVDDISAAGLDFVWRYELRPYLAEYWFEQRAKLDDLGREVSELLSEET